MKDVSFSSFLERSRDDSWLNLPDAAINAAGKERFEKARRQAPVYTARIVFGGRVARDT